MKNKGFTLIELIAVLIILGIMALMIVPSVLKIVKDTKEDAYNNTLINIKSAMEFWKNNNSKYLPKRGEKIYLTISGLKKDKFLDQKIINPLTDKPLPNDMLLTITNNNGSYEYDVLVNSGTETDNYDGLTPYLMVEGPLKKTIYVGDTYNQENVYTFLGDGTETADEVTTTLIDSNKISTSEPGIYYVLHKATINNIPVSYVETIVVEEKNLTCRLKTNATTTGIFTIGDAYICNPGDGIERSFNILSIGATDVSLIMEKNIGGNVAWNSEGEIANGPETVTSYLKRVTRKWNNVSVSLPNAPQIAYASGVSSWNISLETPSLPGWLYSNANCGINICTEKVDDDIGTTSGYWTSSSNEDGAYAVTETGSLVTTIPTVNNSYGVRPLIVVSKEKIEK